MIYFLAKYAGLTVNGQSQGILTVLVFGAGTDYALLLVARYREELRRHEDRHEAMAFALHRAAPAILASAGTVVVGMLCLMLRRDELHRRARPGRRHRRRRHPAGDDHAAAGAAGDLRPVDLLAQAPDVRLRRADRDRALGQGRRPDRRPPAPGLGRSRPLLLAIACLGLFKLDANGLSTEDSYTKEFDSIDGPAGADRARPGRQLQPGHGRRQRRPGRTPSPRP